MYPGLFLRQPVIGQKVIFIPTYIDNPDKDDPVGSSEVCQDVWKNKAKIMGLIFGEESLMICLYIFRQLISVTNRRRRADRTVASRGLS